jgi:tRNA pseudouridine55 synthase
LDGIIIVRKPAGITSFDVIWKLRRILKEKKIGHTGTLDPLAEGVLVVCTGKATRLAKDIEARDKEYEAGFRLGVVTDSYDTEGKILKECEGFSVNAEDIRSALVSFTGKITQKPPMFSAVKQDGKKLYVLARHGVEVEREAREIEISRLELLDFDGREGTLRAVVSKGTYIRSLIHDLGEKLGPGAVMRALVRTRCGDISLDRARTLEEISAMAGAGDHSFLIPTEDFFPYPRLVLSGEKNHILFRNGNTVVTEAPDGLYRIYYENQFAGFGKMLGNRLKGYQYF